MNLKKDGTPPPGQEKFEPQSKLLARRANLRTLALSPTWVVFLVLVDQEILNPKTKTLNPKA